MFMKFRGTNNKMIKTYFQKLVSCGFLFFSFVVIYIVFVIFNLWAFMKITYCSSLLRKTLAFTTYTTSG